MKLSQLDFPWKLLVSAFLIVLSSGFLMAELYLKHTTELVDGKEGLSLDDITIQFYGDETPKLKSQVLGGMKKFFSATEDVRNLKPDELADIDKIVAWVDRGAPEAEYEVKDDKEKNRGTISHILNMRGCIDCHAPDASMKGNKRDSPLDSFMGVSKFTKRNMGIDKGRLLSLSHIHLLGMGMMFLLLGAAVAMTEWPVWVRGWLIVGAQFSILLDIFGWWGVKFYGAPMSYAVMASGVLMAICFLGSVLVSFYDLWIRKPLKPVEVLIPITGSAKNV